MYRPMLFVLAAACLLGCWTPVSAQLNTDQLNKLSLEALTAPPARGAYSPPAYHSRTDRPPAVRRPAYRAYAGRLRYHRAPTFQRPTFQRPGRPAHPYYGRHSRVPHPAAPARRLTVPSNRFAHHPAAARPVRRHR